MDQDLLTNILLVLINTLAPAVTLYVVNLVRQANARAKREHWYAMAHEIARTAVLAAEQLGLKGLLGEFAESKLDYALERCEKELVANGIRVDLDITAEHLRAIIEAQVNQLTWGGAVVRREK
jgi:hypothetical protein